MSVGQMPWPSLREESEVNFSLMLRMPAPVLFSIVGRRPIVAHIMGVRHEWHERQGWMRYKSRRSVLLRDLAIICLPFAQRQRNFPE